MNDVRWRVDVGAGRTPPAPGSGMTRDELQHMVLEVFAQVAPDAQTDTIDAHQSFRDQYEIDSVDFLNFVLELEKRVGIQVPEGDYPKLSSLAGCVDYLAAHDELRSATS